MKAVDLLIVGGGPAGSATAITAASAGLRVILCEREPFPRHAPGETLHPGIEPLLDRLGVGNAVRAAGFFRHSGHWVTWSAPTHFVPFGADAKGPWLGFQADRAVFDTILINRAQQAGAEIWQPCRVGQPMLAGSVQGAETSHGLVRATITVDATGRRGWLASHLHLSQSTVGPQRVAWYGYMNGVCRSRDDAPAMIADANGWTWTARVRAGHYHWTRLPFDSSRPTADWRPEEFQDLNPDGPIRGANVTWRVVDATAGRGISSLVMRLRSSTRHRRTVW